MVHDDVMVILRKKRETVDVVESWTAQREHGGTRSSAGSGFGFFKSIPHASRLVVVYYCWPWRARRSMGKSV